MPMGSRFCRCESLLHCKMEGEPRSTGANCRNKHVKFEDAFPELTVENA